MDGLVLAEKKQQDATEGEPRSLLQEAFHAGAGVVFGDKSKITDAITTYGPEALYTGALFFPGGKAIAASAAIGALNEVHTGTTLQDGAIDAVLGATKGATTKYAFDKIGGVDFTKSMLNAPIKGVVMGSVSTLINSGLSRSTYEQDGKFNLGVGLERTAQSVFSPRALAVDAATFGLASGASVGLNRLTGGLLARSPGLTMMLTGSTFGIASGGIQELSRQSASGNGYDIGKIASQAAIYGAIDGLAAGPAGLKVGFAPKPLPEMAQGGAPIRAPKAEVGSSTVVDRTDTGKSSLISSVTDQVPHIPKDSKGPPPVDSGNGAPLKSAERAKPPILETILSDGTSIRIDIPLSQKKAQIIEPNQITATDSFGKRISIKKIIGDTSEVPNWTIRDKNGSSFSVPAEVRASRDGKLTVSGRQVDMATHNIDEVVSLFVTKPDITPGITAQLETMQRILAPLSEPSASMDARNRALSDIHDFVRNHRSPTLQAEIVDWMRTQPADTQRILSRYYDDPINEHVRQSGFLRDTTFQMMREGALEPSIIGEITKFPDQVDKSTRLTDEQKRNTIKNVVELLDDGNDPRMNQAEQTLVTPGMYRIAAIQSAMHVAEPDTITQYAHPTCVLASLEVAAYTRAPDAATGLVSEVLRTGKFTATDGTVITIDPFSLRPEMGSDKIDDVALNQHTPDAQFRSYASQVFQTTAANVYWQTRTLNPDGYPVPKGSLRFELHYEPQAGNGTNKDSTPVGYVVDYSGPKVKKWEAGGYYLDDVSEISDLISDKLKHRPIAYEALTGLDAFRDWLARAPREDMPVSLAVDARFLSPDLANAPDILSHAINIHASFDPVNLGGRDKWLVAIKNPWNGRAEFMPVTKLWEMIYERPGFKGPAGQTSQTISPVSKEDFARATKT